MVGRSVADASHQRAPDPGPPTESKRATKRAAPVAVNWLRTPESLPVHKGKHLLMGARIGAW